MHSTSKIEVGRPSTIAHPAYCDPSRCRHRGLTVHHCSTPEFFLPRQADTTDSSVVSISIERLDEVDEAGGQVVFPDEIILADDRGLRFRMGAEDMREMVRVAFGLYDAEAGARQLAG